MEVTERSSELLNSPNDSFLEIIHILTRVNSLIKRKFLENHVIVSQRSSLITQKVINPSQLFRDGAIPAHSLGKQLIITNLV